MLVMTKSEAPSPGSAAVHTTSMRRLNSCGSFAVWANSAIQGRLYG
jgi:hypothetical protein